MLRSWLNNAIRYWTLNRGWRNARFVHEPGEMFDWSSLVVHDGTLPSCGSLDELLNQYCDELEGKQYSFNGEEIKQYCRVYYRLYNTAILFLLEKGLKPSLGPDSDGAFATTLLKLYIDLTETRKRSRADQTTMRSDAIKRYNPSADASSEAGGIESYRVPSGSQASRIHIITAIATNTTLARSSLTDAAAEMVEATGRKEEHEANADVARESKLWCGTSSNIFESATGIHIPFHESELRGTLSSFNGIDHESRGSRKNDFERVQRMLKEAYSKRKICTHRYKLEKSTANRRNHYL